MKDKLTQTANLIEDLHRMEEAGMTREQAEATAQTMAHLVSNALEPVKNRLTMLTIENLVAITVIGAGFIGVIFAILQLD